jgi:hypothetical protein
MVRKPFGLLGTDAKQKAVFMQKAVFIIDGSAALVVIA